MDFENFDELNETIHDLRGWIRKAGLALLEFHYPENGTFYIDSREKGEKTSEPKHSTTTNRAFFALYEYYRFLMEEELSHFNETNDVEKVLFNFVTKYLSKLSDNPDYVRNTNSNKKNMFTDGHILISISLLQSLQKILDINIPIEPITGAAKEIVADNIKSLNEWRGGKVNPEDDIHDFVTIAVVRGLDQVEKYIGIDQDFFDQIELENRVKQDILRSLGYHFAGMSSKFDPSELAFSVALLNRFTTPDSQQITQRAVNSIIQTQADDGSWPSAKMVAYSAGGRLHIASYDVALTLTNLLIRNLSYNKMDLCAELIPALNKAVKLVISHYDSVNGLSGWANDHARKTGVLESWATAIVLTFLIHYHDALIMLRRNLLLDKYKDITILPYFETAINLEYRDKAPVNHAWPDLTPAFRQSDWINVTGFSRISDPSDDSKLEIAVDSIINEIMSDWLHRPKEKTLLLYGPPGTRKTSLIRCIANILQWPLLIFSPPHFLRNGGLDGFEISAEEIFNDLMRLRRTVVLFDECEDFFKKRTASQQPDMRTTGAFLTSGMLPRLQMLHDKGWLIFVLVTNSDVEDLDSAVTRWGRFDYVHKINVPTLKAQIRYVERSKSLPEPVQGIVSEVLTKYAQSQDSDRKFLTFSVIDRICDFCSKDSELSVDAVFNKLRELEASGGFEPLY